MKRILIAFISLLSLTACQPLGGNGLTPVDPGDHVYAFTANVQTYNETSKTFTPALSAMTVDIKVASGYGPVPGSEQLGVPREGIGLWSWDYSISGSYHGPVTLTLRVYPTDIHKDSKTVIAVPNQSTTTCQIKDKSVSGISGVLAHQTIVTEPKETAKVAICVATFTL